jgi:DNA-binding Lrp family transcriptional regulator
MATSPTTNQRSRRTTHSRAVIREVLAELDKNERRRPGRPRAQVDPERVKTLAAAGLKVVEIAEAVGVDRTTLYNRFSTELERGRALGNGLIRRVAFELAINHKFWPAIKFLYEKRLGIEPAQAVAVDVNVNVGVDASIEANINTLIELKHKIEELEAEMRA